MADIPLAPPTPSSSTAATTAASPGLVAVQVSVTNVPAALGNLTRTIQAHATPLIVTDASNLTLATILGNITVALSQQLGVAEKQTLTQQLITMMQVQRSLTLTLQPGSPPTQGALLFPMTTFPTSVQTIQGRAFPPVSAAQAQPLTAGSNFRAVVLPLFPPPAAFLAEVPSSATRSSFAGMRPLNPAPVTENIYTVFAPPSGINEPSVAIQTPTTVVQQTFVPQAPPVSLAPTPVQQTTLSNVAQPTPPAAQTSSSAPFQPVIIPQQPAVSKTPQTPIPTQQPNVSIPSQSAQAPSFASTPQAPITPQQASIQIRPDSALPPTSPPTPTLKANAAVSQTLLPAVPAKAETPVPTAFFAPAPPNIQPPPGIPPQIYSLLIPGNEVSLHVVSVLPASAESTGRQAQPPTLAPNQIVATVSGTGTDGQLILKAGDATLFVKAQISAPAGTSVIVSVNEVKNSSLVTLPPSEEPAFPSLPHVLAALEQVSPRVLQNVMLNFLPRPTDALPGALLFLLSAFKQGNVRDWLGDNTVDILANAGKSDVVRRLSRELSDAGQPAQDAVVGEWRTYPIPLYAGQQFQSLTLYVHSDRDARKDKSQNTARDGKIRFVIDMRMSKLGAMQIDGFVQKKKLDMILRSENVLPEGLHMELRRGYIKALDAVGYMGTLNFQVGRHHWMVMQKSAPPGIVT